MSLPFFCPLAEDWQNLLGGYGINDFFYYIVYLAKIFVQSASCIYVASDFSDFYQYLTLKLSTEI